jgi:hypothetical protein
MPIRRWNPAGLSLAVALMACGGQDFSLSRPEPVPYADTLPAPQPAADERREAVLLLQEAVVGEIGSTLSVRRALGAAHEAIDITHFDDVVSSAWFQHRNGRDPMTADEVARGPSTGSPNLDGKLKVTAPKTGGITPGFTIEDADGVTYFVKFDPKGNLHLSSAAGVISNRLFYAAGYYTPEDYIIVFDSAQLVVDSAARVGEGDDARPMTGHDVRRVLEGVDPLPDGRYLAIASKKLPGKLLGPFHFSGNRDDDPNDYFDHEYRRELRGLYVLSAWLNHVDMRFANTRDVYIDPPGYVRHYLFDFGATLGSGTIRPHNAREGIEYNFDFWSSMERLFTLGFFRMGWEGADARVIHPAIGYIPTKLFDPGGWRANWPNDAFRRVTARDGYWGAKLVGSFTEPQIRAAVSEGHLPAEAADTLVRILAYRREKTIEYWYGKVTPIENVQVDRRVTDGDDGLVVSFEDLGLTSGVWDAASTRYSWRLHDRKLGLRSSGEQPGLAAPRQSLALAMERRALSSPPAEPDELTELRIRAVRPTADGREAVIYLRWMGKEVGYQVVGLTH